MVTRRLSAPRAARLAAWARTQSGFEWAAIILALLVGLALLLGRLSSAVAPVPTMPATSAPLIVYATPAPTHPAPTLIRDSSPAFTQAVVAYAAPDGAVLGAIEAGRTYQVLARCGLAWTQLAVEHSGAVWVRTADLDPIEGAPDIATPVPPQVIYAAAPPALAAAPAAEALADTAHEAAPVAPTPRPPVAFVLEHGQTADGRKTLTSRALIAPGAPRLCWGFGDWRDYDPMYMFSPVCRGGAHP